MKENKSKVYECEPCKNKKKSMTKLEVFFLIFAFYIIISSIYGTLQLFKKLLDYI